MDGREEIRQQLGVDRGTDPAGALPQPAERLGAAAPPARRRGAAALGGGGPPNRMRARIEEIVRARGKMHNPDTDSGGILMGTVSAVGERLDDPPPVGAPVVTLGRL